MSKIQSLHRGGLEVVSGTLGECNNIEAYKLYVDESIGTSVLSVGIQGLLFGCWDSSFVFLEDRMM